ncbi:MAG: TatD family hydrolase [Candidatus Avilachnospira sp.]|jgi:TatD DNase family protein
MIFDTHAHYDDKAFDMDRDELLSELKASGIGRVCNVGARLEGSRNSIELAEKYDFFCGAVGIHPDDCGDMDESWLNELRSMAAHEKVVAIGEIGLDYHGFGVYEDKVDKETQIKWFREQLKLAIELSMPVIIHSRNAAQDTLDMMREAHENGLKGGIIHCFSYSQETAKEYVKMGFYLGFGGVVTYEGQRKLTKVLGAVPMENIVLETDCPYLAPAPHRYERNSSLYLPLVRDKIAQIKGISPEEVERITYENGLKVYGLRSL